VTTNLFPDLSDVSELDPTELDAALVDALGGLDDWAHNCHGASLALVRSGLLGPAARVGRGACAGVGGQHSWVVVDSDPYAVNARIVDPTLWSYADEVVGIWYGSAHDDRHCPHGGSGTIWTYGRPAEPVGDVIDLTPTEPLSDDAEAFLDLLGPLDKRGWSCLVNGPVIGWPAAEIVAAIDDTPSLSVLVPIDVLGMLTERNPGGLYR
jgi:hypothetical protein